MATFGIESGSVDNRAFSSVSGVGKKFKDWVVKTPANHGPGWFIIDDRSTDAVDPYIVVCNQSSPTPNSKAVFFQFQVSTNSELIYIRQYLAWDATTHVGLVYWQGHQLTTKTGAFAYYFRGGQDFLMVLLRDGTNIYHARLSRWVGIWDGAKGTEPESTSGILANPLFYATDPGGYISAFNQITGYKNHLDANGKLYFNIILFSGSTYFINIYKDSARTQLIGHTANFTNTTIGSKAITPDATSGLGGSIWTGITVAAATNIDCRFLRLDLGSGQGAAFRVGKFYFLVDLVGAARVCYVQIESKSGDQLVLVAVNPLAFLTGSYISPYPHRWLSSGSVSIINTATMIPYVSSFGSEALAGSGITGAGLDYLQGVVAKANPDDEGDFALMAGWVYELSFNRYWGTEPTVLIAAGNGLAALIDRRVVAGVPYIAISTGTIATVVLDVESLS